MKLNHHMVITCSGSKSWSTRVADIAVQKYACSHHMGVLSREVQRQDIRIQAIRLYHSAPHLSNLARCSGSHSRYRKSPRPPTSVSSIIKKNSKMFLSDSVRGHGRLATFLLMLGPIFTRLQMATLEPFRHWCPTFTPYVCRAFVHHIWDTNCCFFACFSDVSLPTEKGKNYANNQTTHYRFFGWRTSCLSRYTVRTSFPVISISGAPYNAGSKVSSGGFTEEVCAMQSQRWRS